MNEKMTAEHFRQMKSQEKIAVLTAYDYLTAQLLDEVGIDAILVGDSVGMVFSGHETTLPVTMDEIVYHTKAVRRGVKRALLIGDLPFLSFQVSPEDALVNAGRLLQEAGAEAVKIEGGQRMVETIGKLTGAGIPVMGHLGLTPQSIHQFGGYRVRGKSQDEAQRLIQDAQAIEKAGCFSVVLEKIPSDLAGEISQRLKIPTIGIGAGPECDGQVLVVHDMLGLFEKFKPRFVRRYARLAEQMRGAFQAYIQDVKEAKFPSPEESY
ncbi:3-methyl-2-oxobutanoate hydroxymethyltransferase [bacterium]|nr:3-methyl-2-oxobutanoate hydroxymethyltransferase [bacterium]